MHNSGRRFLLTIVLAGMVLRVGLIAPRLDSMEDHDNYLPLAISVAAGEGLAINGRLTAYRPPLYPLLLAPITRIFGRHWSLGVGLFHVSLGGATILLTWYSARSWNLGVRASLIAAFLVAFDPVLAVQSRSVMTETLAAFLVALNLALVANAGNSSRRGDWFAGVVMGLSVLCRPSFLPGAGLMVLCRLNSSWRCWSGTILLLTGLGLPLTVWAWRNQQVLGVPIFTTTHGGYTLALANNEAYYADVINGPSNAVWSGPHQKLWWDDLNLRTTGMTESQADRYLRNEALALAARRPRDFLRASLARLGRFWGLSPSSEVYSPVLRWITWSWTAPFWVCVALGICHRESWKWPRNSAICVIFGLMFVHTFYWTDLRMRAPVVPALALIAASGVAHWIVKIPLGSAEVN